LPQNLPPLQPSTGAITIASTAASTASTAAIPIPQEAMEVDQGLGQQPAARPVVPQDLWECLQVQWYDHSELMSSFFPKCGLFCRARKKWADSPSAVSPWELDDMDGEGQLKPLIVDCISPMASLSLVTAFQDACKNLGQEVTGLFMTPVPLAAYPSYIKKIAYPSDVTTICSRLESCYYRTVLVRTFSD